MKHLDFPNSAAAVRLHGRQYHDQDFLSCGPRTTEAQDPMVDWRPAVSDGLGKLLRFTAICVALAFAAAVVLSWLVRPDIAQVSLIDSSNGRSTSSTH